MLSESLGFPLETTVVFIVVAVTSIFELISFLGEKVTLQHFLVGDFNQLANQVLKDSGGSRGAAKFLTECTFFHLW